MIKAPMLEPRAIHHRGASRFAIEAALAPLDRLRAALLALLGRRGGALWRDRELRVALLGSVSVTLSLLLTLGAPLWLLALGPVLLGVPHLWADLRYLVLRPALHRRQALWILCGLPVLLVGVTGWLVPGVVGVAGAILASRAPLGRRLGALALFALLAVPALWRPYHAGVLLSHLHNLVAVGFFLAWRARDRRLHLWPVALLCAGAALLSSGAAEPILEASGGLWAPGSGVSLGLLMDTLAPGLDDRWALRVVLLFAFAQSVHYALWLRLIPDEDRAQKAPRSFTSSYRALRADLGAPLLWIGALLTVAIAAWAAASLGGARDGYLRLALFHGYLELCAAALLLTEGRRARCSPRAAR